jgi:hypothetical protein
MISGSLDGLSDLFRSGRVIALRRSTITLDVCFERVIKGSNGSRAE